MARTGYLHDRRLLDLRYRVYRFVLNYLHQPPPRESIEMLFRISSTAVYRFDRATYQLVPDELPMEFEGVVGVHCVIRIGGHKSEVDYFELYPNTGVHSDYPCHCLIIINGAVQVHITPEMFTRSAGHSDKFRLDPR
jgi:hypothetical protein